MEYTIFTKEISERAKSSNGGWSGAQLALLGYDIRKLEKGGWLSKCVGVKFPKEKVDQFIALKDAHAKNRQVKTEKYTAFTTTVPEYDYEFISLADQRPTIPGWYIVKTQNNEFEAYFKEFWLLHSDVLVTHWKDTRFKLF